MTATIEHGVVRQVWFAPVDSPTTRHRFIIRDDAYSKREAVFGRTIRLGEPVDLGPFGGWRQTNWSGGYDQETWRDDAMFELGSADVSERKGAVKLWNGFTGIHGAGNTAAQGMVPNIMLSGVTGLGEDTPLLTGDRRMAGASTDYKVRKWNPTTGTVTEIQTFTSQIEAMSLIANETGDSANSYILVGLASGAIWKWNQNTDVWAQDTGVPGSGRIGHRAMCPFNYATYYVRGNALQKRQAGTHTLVRELSEIDEGRGMVVWNNRLWFAGVIGGGRSAMFVSDGYTVQKAFEIPGSFRPYDCHPHYGSLYIRGAADVTTGTDIKSRQQIWRYNGSSLTLLYEDDESDTEFTYLGNMASWGRFLVFPKHGSDAFGREVGVWFYDAEEDALYMGPTMPIDTESRVVYCAGITQWNNTLAVSLWDNTVYTAGTIDKPWHLYYVDKSKRFRAVKLDGSTTVDEDQVKDTIASNSGNINGTGQSFDWAATRTEKEQVVLSSNYDANLPGEKKTWAKGFVRCRVPQGCQVELALLLDDDPTEHSVKTISYDAGVGSGWQDVQFSAVCATHTKHEVSSKVRYKLYLRNVDLQNFPNNTPEVDVVGLDFMPTPSRRSQYHVRCLADDGQLDLAGAANPLTTREALVAKLTEYWQDGVPVYFWEPRSDATEPTDTTDAKTVLLQDFLEQTFRLDSESTDAYSEVAFNLLEVA